MVCELRLSLKFLKRKNEKKWRHCVIANIPQAFCSRDLCLSLFVNYTELYTSKKK